MASKILMGKGRTWLAGRFKIKMCKFRVCTKYTNVVTGGLTQSGGSRIGRFTRYWPHVTIHWDYTPRNFQFANTVTIMKFSKPLKQIFLIAIISNYGCTVHLPFSEIEFQVSILCIKLFCM